MTILKKFSILILSFALLFGVIACSEEISTTTTTATTTTTTTTATTTTEDADLVILTQVSEVVTIENSDNITEDFSLLAAYGNVDISCSSSNQTVVSIATTETTEGSNTVYLVTVSPFTVDTVVILTATFSYNSKTYIKYYSITVKPAIDDGSYTLISELYENAAIDETVTLSGYVSVIYKGGYVITDTTGNSLIVFFSSSSTTLTVKVGDHVSVTGKYAQYQSLFQIKDPTIQTINSSDNSVTLAPTVLEDATDLLEVDSTLKLNHGKVYTVTVTPVLNTNNDVELYVGTTKVTVVYYNSLATSIDALKEFIGREVTIDVMYYTLHSTDGVRVLFYGTEEDIISDPLTVEEQFTIDSDKLDIDLTLTDSLVLPTLEFAEYDTITISTNLTNYIEFVGDEYVITRPLAGETDVTGTLTVKITIGTEYRDIIIDVTVKAISNAVATDLFISEYIEGSSFNKLIELYNATGTTIDLSEYTIELYSNGAASASQSLTLSGTLLNGQTFAIHHDDASTETLGKANIEMLSSLVINFNGDDAIVLKHNGVIIDSIGQIGADPGTEWASNGVSTLNMTLVRKSYITSGDTNPLDAYDPSFEWIAYPQDTFTYIGTHVMD